MDWSSRTYATTLADIIPHASRELAEAAALGDPISLIRGCVENPAVVANGEQDELVALRPLEGMQRFLAVFYVEDSRVITAFVTSKPESFMRRGIVWKK
jgi:hypothetical protein